MTTLLITAAALATGAWAAPFRLESEKRYNYGASVESTLTVHTYDDKGARSAKRSYHVGGVEPIGTTLYEYDVFGRVSIETVLAGRDTLALSEYVYALGPLPIEVAVRGKGGTLRYIDSFTYDVEGKLRAESRQGGVEGLLFQKRYGYDSGGRLVADTLSEPGPSGLESVSIRTVIYNPDGTAEREVHLRRAETGWHLWKSVVMGYAHGRLERVMEFAGEAGTGRRQDSMTFAYDGSGNRTQELQFDEDNQLVRKTLLFWSGGPTVLLRRSREAGDRVLHAGPSWSWRTGRNLGRDLRGRKVLRK